MKKLIEFSKSNSERLFPAGILILGIVLRLLFLGREGFWHDEALTALALKLPFGDMIRERLAAGHSPLYFILLYPVAQLFGTGEIVLRLPSVLASTGSLWVFYLLAKRLARRSVTALLSTLFFSLSSVNVYYAQEARMYTLCLFFVICSFYFLSRAVMEPEDRRTIWVWYALSTSMALYMSSAALPVLAAQGVFVLAKRKRIAPFILSLCAVFLIYLPMAFFYITQSKLSAIEWLPPVTVRTVLEIPYSFGFRPVPLEVGFGVYTAFIPPLEMLSLMLPGIVLAVSLGDSIFKRPAGTKPTSPSSGSAAESMDKQKYLLPLLWLAVPISLEVLFSLLKQPVFGPKRYLLVFSPAYYLLIGLGIEGIRNRSFRRAMSLIFPALFVMSLFFFFTQPTREDWRGAIRYMDREINPGEVLYGNLSTQTLYRYYGKYPDLIIMDINDAASGIFTEGWMMLRERDAKIVSRLLTALKNSYKLTEIEGYRYIRLYRFSLPGPSH